MAAVNSSERRQGDPNDELGDPGENTHNTDVSFNKQRHFDWSETEDEEDRTDAKENGNDEWRKGGRGGRRRRRRRRGRRRGPTVKRRKCSLECKDCGKRFTRRETFNLHRHFHAHQDELASLTCKECGLTFHHRSSLIKHRSEHQQKVEQPVERKRRRSPQGAHREPTGSPQGVHREERPGFQCDHCEETFPSLSKLRLHTCDCAPDKAYRCPLCRKEFRMKISITSHMQTHSLSSHPFRCQECHKSFSDIFSLRDHQGSHASLKPYACPECGMVFRHRSVMEDHRRKHTEDTQGPHRCNICGKHFKYSSLLQQHQYLHTGQKPFRCPDCGKTFALAQNMKAHCRQHRRHPHACSLCPLTFPDQGSLQAHVSCHETVGGLDKENTNHGLEPKRIFNCPLCPQNFPSPADLRAHMLIHEAEHERMENGACKDWETDRYTCPHCPATYSDQSNMMAHLTTHTSARVRVERQGNGLEVGRSSPLNTANVPGRWHREEMSSKPLKCPDCGKSFRHRSVLTLHMRIHSKDKPYQCRVCNKSFRFNSYLQQHMIIHTGEKPYKCPDCSKDFAFLQNMRTHQRLHTQKPFRCTKCRKGYSDENQLQRHLLSHNGEKPHKCHLCEKSFGLAYLLRDHLNTHTGERPHRCQECHKTFPWLGSLLVHQKIHARKRQGSSQPYSFPMAMRIRGRGRSGGRLASGWPRLGGMGRSGMGTPQQTPPYQVPMSRSPEWQRRPAQPQPTMFSSQMDMQQPGETSARRPPPVHQQWRVEGGELRPVPLPNQSQPSQDPERQPAPVQQQPSPQTQPQQVPQSPLIQQQVQLQLQLQPHLHPQLRQQQVQHHLQSPLIQQQLQWQQPGVQLQPQLVPQQQWQPARHLLQQKLPWLPDAQPRPAPPQQPQQWHSDGLPRPPPQQQQRNSGRAEAPTTSQPGLSASQSLETPPPGESGGTMPLGNKTPPVAGPQNPSPLAVSEQEQHRQQPKPMSWGNTPTTPPVPTLSSVQLDFPGSPIYMDGAALWGGLRTSPAVPPSQSTLNKLGQELNLPRWSSVSVPMQKAVNESPTPPRKEDTRVWDFNAPLVMSPTVSSSEKPGSGREQQKQWSPALLSTSSSAQMSHSSVMSISSPPTHGIGGSPWDFKGSPSNKSGLSQELEQQQQKHLSSSWTNVPTSTQNVPISIQYDPQRFTHGVGPTVWGFQTTPSGPQQQPMVTGTQIIINQTSPFFSPLPPLPPLSLPGSHPLHSVAVGSLPRPPHPNIFFTPQAVMSERPHMTQTLSLPQLAPRPVPHKLGRLPYAPDRLLQCMICGCSLPRELDLQMHYMQHAQGEI
ncbi:zinc finger protein 628 [Oncorhynchus nerka]|uniref:zinc finger protein 628 n=1 Tax=Oncorhynchus nerka TaxID=8023 RepID=UPI0031B88972